MAELPRRHHRSRGSSAAASALILCLLAACIMPGGARAADLMPPDQICVRALFMGYNSFSFADQPSANRSESTASGDDHGDRDGRDDDEVEALGGADFCHNKLKQTSMYAAGKVHCAASDAEEDFAPIVEQLRDFCRKWGGGGEGDELMPVPALVRERSVEELRGGLRPVEYQEVPKGEQVDEVVLLSDAFYKRCFETIYTMWAHKNGGTTMYEFWGVVFFIAAAGQVYRHLLRDPVSRVQHSARKAFRFSLFQPILDSVERWTPEGLTYERVPGVVVTEKDFRSCFNFKVFPVGETLAIWTYWVLSITLNLANYRFYNGSIYFPEMPQQVFRYSADRTGILSYANLPMLWLFSGRNNIFMWVTGWKFPTFIRFHLHVAWIATLEAIAHSVLYTFLTVKSDIFWIWIKADWFFVGVIATFVMTLLVIISTPVWLRERYYEVFIDSHILSSLAVLVGLFVHTSVFDHEYDWYLWVPAILWILDRGLRLCRIIFFNIGFKDGRINRAKTTATYDVSSNIIELEIVPGPSIAPPRPGQYYFLYQPFSIRGYENHPMTLGTWRRHGENTPDVSGEEQALKPTRTSSLPIVQDDDDDAGPLHPCTSAQPLLSPRTASPSAPSPIRRPGPSNPASKAPTTLTFWIRPYDGWTRRIRDQCIAHDRKSGGSYSAGSATTSPCHPLILLEGPYGATHALPGSYDATVLVAGGSGISAAVPYLREHSRRRRLAYLARKEGGEEMTADPETGGLESAAGTVDAEEPGGQKASSAAAAAATAAAVQLVWVAREEAFIRRVEASELRGGLVQGDFAARFFCTATRSGLAADRERGEGEEVLEIQKGRPDVRSIIGEAAQGVCEARAREGKRGKGKVAVLLCGPPGMAKGVEAAVRGVAEEFDCWVDYFDEVFSW